MAGIIAGAITGGAGNVEGIQQISNRAQTGHKWTAHGSFEHLEMEFIAKEEGYLMTYTANETNEDLNVFMDDMTVTHTTGPIVRVDDYYPFGLTFNTSERAGSLSNKYLFNGKERQEITGWDDFGARMYMADIGRWGVVDAFSTYHPNQTPYRYSFNNPINVIDPDGNLEIYVNGERVKGKQYSLWYNHFFGNNSNNDDDDDKNKAFVPGAGYAAAAKVIEEVVKKGGASLGPVIGGAVAFIGAMLYPHNAGGKGDSFSLSKEEEQYKQDLELKESQGALSEQEKIDLFNFREREWQSWRNHPEGYLRYQGTAKHGQGGWGTKMDLDPKTASWLLNNSIQLGKQRYGYYNQSIYEFQYDNVYSWHGYPINSQELVSKKGGTNILKQWLNNGIISQAEYNKLLKGK